MKKYIYTNLLIALALFMSSALFAGNPDRQGEAGAYELLMNPWARSAGLHTMSTANVTGVEALRINPSGLVRVNRTEVLIGHGRYLSGTEINMNAVGISQKVGKSGAFGVSIMTVDFGDIPVTTEAQPEGTGATFSPNWFNIGLSYAHMFENKVSVGITFRAVSETTPDVSAFGFAIDAGVQYVTGPQDNVKFGISLRNVGSPMTFRGEGISVQRPSPDSEGDYDLTYYNRSQDFELPSMLNIGLSYDFLLGDRNRLTALGNFTAHSFSRDQIGAGLEYAFNEMFMVRAAYRYEVGSGDAEVIQDPIYDGVSAGASLQIPATKKGDSKVALDYAWRSTTLFDGTHNISLRFSL